MVIKWLQTALSASKKLVNINPKTFIGADHLGNKYYETVRSTGKIQRFVENNVKPEDYVPGKLPLEWEAWVRGGRQEPPTDKEIDRNRQFTAIVQQRAAIKTKEDDEKQMQAYKDGLIAREGSTDDTPEKQALSKKPIKRSKASAGHASTGGSYEPDTWSPGNEIDTESTPRKEPEAWTPGGKM